MTGAMRVEAESFESVSDAWSSLLPQCPDATVFHSPAWQSTWWRFFGAGARLKLFSFIDASDPPGRMTGLAPLMARDGVISFLGDTDLVDYHDFIAAWGASQPLFNALVDRLGASDRWQTAKLASIPGGSVTLDLLPAAAEKAGWRVRVEQEDVAPRLALPGSWDDYIAGLGRKDRHELRRKLRRLEKAGEVRPAEIRDRDELLRDADDFFRLLRMSSAEKARFMTPERERFFRAVMGEMAREGVARLRFLELDGKRVATSLSFVFGGARLLYNSGYDPEYRDLSVGLLNHAMNIRQSIEEGLQWFDFMRGNEAYKYHLGAEDRLVHRVVISR